MTLLHIKGKLEEEINSLKRISLCREIRAASEKAPAHVVLVEKASALIPDQFGLRAKEGSFFSTRVPKALTILEEGTDKLLRVYTLDRDKLAKHCDRRDCDLWVAQEDVKLSKLRVAFHNRLLSNGE